jgi:MOB kinase activator 1
MSFFGLGAKSKTFRPQKNVSESRPAQVSMHQHLHSTLGTGNLREAVKLPEGEDEAEWYAVNVVDFYNQISML